MIKVGLFDYVDPGSVEAIIERGGNDSEFPYMMAIRMRSGYEVKCTYRTFGVMQKEADMVAKAVTMYRNGNDLTPDTVRKIVVNEVDKIRPYLRRIERMVRGDTACESENQ